MSTRTPPKTLLELCRETSQAEVAAKLGITRQRINRCVTASIDVDTKVLILARERFGNALDFDRTALDWIARRVARIAGIDIPTTSRAA